MAHTEERTVWYITITSPRQRLLDAVVAYALDHGIADQSLRSIADAIGTSHRMLIHHFGSKEHLLVEVTRAVEERQLELLEGIGAGGSKDAVWDFWVATRDKRLHPQERLFFEIYAQALRGRAWAQPLLDGDIERWIEPAAIMVRQRGVAPAEARARARLGVAVTRGLLLDLLATGDLRAVDGAMRQFLELLRR